jgi:pimeloyl-ACP methyl ester carboxylesterase
VLAPTLAGHAGGPPLSDPVRETDLADGVERAMDEAGFATAHIVGNSLGGAVALQLAARGRAESVVALAPAGGWADGDGSHRETLAHFSELLDRVPAALPYVDQLLATRQGRRMATQFITVRYEHIPPDLLAHQIAGVAGCSGARRLIEHALDVGWSLPDAPPPCPVRLVWGTEDQLLRWPTSAARFREPWLAGADWVVLDDVGHCPQLDVPETAAELILEFTGRS